MAELAEPARDAHTGGPRRRPEREGDLVVLELVDHAQLDGCALILRQLVERLVESLEPRVVRFRRRRRVVEPIANAEPRARARLDAAAPHRLRDEVPRDAEEPRPGGAVSLVAEALAGEPRLRERLRCQVESGVLVAGAREVESVDAVGVPVVELAKGRGICVRGAYECGIVLIDLLP